MGSDRSRPVYSGDAVDAVVDALEAAGVALTDEQVERVREAVCALDPVEQEPDDGMDYDDDGPDYSFADPHGRSALRAASRHNPRDRDCPTCGRESVLTREDEARGYQCDRCADAAEGRCWAE